MTAVGGFVKFNQMVEQEIELDALFGALADPTRRAILTRLQEGGASVSEVAAPFPVSLQAVSKHLRVLEGAGLIERQVQGRTHRLHLVKGALDEADHWLDQQRSFWDERFDELETHLSARTRGRRAGLPKGRGR